MTRDEAIEQLRRLAELRHKWKTATRINIEADACDALLETTCNIDWPALLAAVEQKDGE